MKLFGWDLGWSRNVAIGVIWTTPGYGVKNGFKSYAIMFLGVTLSKNFPVVKE